MVIRDSLTLTWQDLDQSPLSLFTDCEEAMATKPNTNSSTARLWNANTQATYHRMMEKMQALYYAHILIVYTAELPAPITPVLYDRAIGLDYAQDGLYRDSNGHSAEYPGFAAKSKPKREALQQALSRACTHWQPALACPACQTGQVGPTYSKSTS